MDFPLSDHAMKTLLFGKLPVHGDFVSRGFSSDSRNDLDDWLSGEMERGRACLGESFDEVYERAPPWRFVAREGSAWMAGAIAPSVDSAGRKFPLVLACALPSPHLGASIAARCEDGLYEALEHRWSADTICDWEPQLDDPIALQRPPPLWWTEGNAEFAPDHLEGTRPTGLISVMLGYQKVKP